MNNEKISIIVPVYNLEKHIGNTVKSIIEQTHQNLEVILVDDGSTDNSYEIMQTIHRLDDRVKIVHQSNGGVIRARLTGVREAAGEWIGFVDGDDWIEPEMYQTLLNNALKYNAQISHCGYQMVFPSKVDYYWGTGRFAKQDRQEGLKDLLSGSIEPSLCNKLFHKSLFQSLLHDGVMIESIKNNEDLLMNYYLYKECDQSVFIDECYYHYILRKGSATNTFSTNYERMLDPIKVHRQILADCESEEPLAKIENARIASCLIALATSKIVNQYVQNIVNNSRAELKSLAPTILKGDYSHKLKNQVRLAVASPRLYSILNRIYQKVKGTEHKYEIR